MNGRAVRSWGCGGVGHHIAECPGRSLPVARADGSFFRGPFGGELKRGGGDVAGAPGVKARPLRGGSGLRYVSRSHGPVRGAPLGPR